MHHKTDTIMRKGILALAVFVAAACCAQGQLLYRIDGNGLKAPSYIVGTYHLAPATFADSIPGLRAALDAVEQVYGEVDMQSAMSAEGMEKAQKAQMLPEEVTLSSLLSAEQMDRLNAVMREVMGLDMSNAAVAAQMDKLSPAALSATLTMLMYMKNMAGFNPMNLLDGYLQQEAQKQGKGVGGFESVDFQADVLYGAPLDKQVKDLMCMVDNFSDAMDMVDFITAAYFSQDLEQIEEMLDEEQEGACSGDPADEDRLLGDRNAAWVRAMPAIMERKATLFAVGAAHLVGENGVLKMLESKGYSVEGVRK